jgi:SAM-dependent methyltransferase
VLTKSIPDRIVWAVQALNLVPTDEVLEIGCGPGVAVPLVCEKLDRGTLIAIDRSKKMIAAAMARNHALAAAGKVRFEAVALTNADLPRHRFSKIFAINVNLFWLGLSPEFALLRKLLRPGGALHITYEPPKRTQLNRIGAKLASNLKQGGFILDAVISAPTALTMISHPSKSAR